MSPSSYVLSANTYAEAVRLMRANPDRIVSWDSGAGWLSEGRYDSKLRRNVIASINPKGEYC